MTEAPRKKRTMVDEKARAAEIHQTGLAPDSSVVIVISAEAGVRANAGPLLSPGRRG